MPNTVGDVQNGGEIVLKKRRRRKHVVKAVPTNRAGEFPKQRVGSSPVIHHNKTELPVLEFLATDRVAGGHTL